MRQKITSTAIAALLLLGNLAASNLYTFTSSKDNTIIETTDGSKANSLNLIYVGNIAQSPSIRRGLVAFDLSSLPATLAIDSVKLMMSLSSSTANTIELHKVTSGWGEGSANASGGAGVAATTNDVTWLHSSYNTVLWATAGGDFESTIASTASIAAGATSVTFRGSALKTQVAAWLASPATNYGWLLKSNDESTASGKIEKFYSNETGADGQKPTLYIYYSTTTDIAKTSETTSYIYPTAATSTLHIAHANELKRIEITDLNGKSAMTIQPANEVYIGSLTKGLYLVKLETATGIICNKLIKQ